MIAKGKEVTQFVQDDWALEEVWRSGGDRKGDKRPAGVDVYSVLRNLRVLWRPNSSGKRLMFDPDGTAAHTINS